MTSSSNSNSDQPRSSKDVADVSILREVARNSLVHALNSVRHLPVRLWCAAVNRLQGERGQDSRAGPFSRWTTWLGHGGVFTPSIYKLPPIFSVPAAYSITQQHGVDKMFWLESGPLSAVTTSIVYLCRPRIKWVKIIAGNPFY
jgi:hypothetical protein